MRLVKTIFFFLVINFCDWQEVAFNWDYNIFVSYSKQHAVERQVKQHADVKNVNQCHSFTIISCHSG